MQIGNAAALYFLATLAVVLLFYLLKGRRRDVTIPSVLLWRDIKFDASIGRPRLRLIPELLLFLQLLTLLFLVLALLEPYWPQERGAEQRTVVVVDGSASMLAADGGGQRFDQARQAAGGLIDQLAGGGPVALIQAGAEPEMLVELTRDTTAIRRAVDGLTAYPEALDLAAALDTAAGLLEEEPGSRIIIISDGSFAKPDYTHGPALELIQVGSDQPNLGITELAVRSHSGRLSEYQILVEVTNHGPQTQTIPLRIRQDGRTMVLDSITIPGDSAEAFFYNLRSTERAAVEVELEVEDALAVDNRAYAVIGRDDELRVLLVGESHFFLERGLLAIPFVRLFHRTAMESADYELFDLVIFDGAVPAEQPQGHVVFWNTLPQEYAADMEPVRQRQRVTSWRTDHPLFRFVDLSELELRQYLQAPPIPGWQPLIRGESGVLAASFTQPEYQGLYIGFDVRESSFPLQVGFPVFLANMFEWFFPQFFHLDHLLVETGEILRYTARTGREPQQVFNPAGEPLPLFRSPDQYLVAGTRQPGLYTLELADASTEQFAVNLLSKQETILTPLQSSGVLAPGREAVGTSLQIHHLWPYFALLACLLLVGEWYAYHRPRLR